MKIEQLTADKCELKFMPSGNRTINSKKVSQIKLSVQQYGIIRGLVVIKTNLFNKDKKYHHYIADGQHLFLAVQALDRLNELPIFVVECEFSTIVEIIDFVSTINAAQSQWKLLDYVGAYASTNQITDYNVLLSKFQKYGISLVLTAAIYGGSTCSRTAQLLKRGQFKIVDESRGDEIAKIIQDIVPIFGRANSVPLEYFTKHFYHWYNSVNYNHEKFLKLIKDNTNELLVLGEQGVESVLNKYTEYK